MCSPGESYISSFSVVVIKPYNQGNLEFNLADFSEGRTVHDVISTTSNKRGGRTRKQRGQTGSGVEP